MLKNFAVSTNTYHGFSVDEALTGISNAGFSFVELAAVRNWTEHVMPEMSAAEIEQVKKQLSQLNLSCLAVSGHCNLTDKERLNDFRRNMKLANDLGAKYIISSTGEAHFGEDEQFTDDVLINNIKDLLPDLEKYDLQLGIEVHGEYGTGEDVARIVKGVGSERVGINFDTANVVFYGNVDPVSDLNACLEYVNFIHLKDKIGFDNVWNFPAVGSGELPLVKILQIVDSVSKEIPVSIEIEFTEDFTMRDKIAGEVDVVNKSVQDSFAYLKEQGFVG
ncbi:MAG: sugar phosphate isomerase/epimerase [Clostridiaceae bacterium]|nr:sugar phosphate isomerase/epimerase [Clostridiaceae bacterium]